MKSLVMLLALAACEKTKPASLDAVDRTCKVDADCTLTGFLGCCDTSCGEDVGIAVNAKAWWKVSERFRADCKEECNVLCPKLPDCRDEKFAFCDKGFVCQVSIRKTAACEQSPSQ